MTADLILTNALIVTADAAGTVIRDGALAATDGRIAAIGPAAAIGRDAREVFDAGGMLLAPGLINTHCHAGCSLFRGLVEGLPLEPWLQQVWRAEGAILNPETGRLGAPARPRREPARRRHHGDGHVLAAARDGRGGARRSGCGSRPARSSSTARAWTAWTREARIADAERFFADFARRRGRAGRGAAARDLHRRAGPAAGRLAARGRRRRALVDPRRRDPRRAGRRDRPLRPLGDPPPRPPRPARRAHRARALRLARRRGDRASWRGPARAVSHNPVSNLKLASRGRARPRPARRRRAGHRSAPTARSPATTSTCGWRCGSRRRCTTARRCAPTR